MLSTPQGQPPVNLKPNGKPYKELVKIAQPPIIRRRKPFVMPGVSCKTMFNNELWTVTNRCLPISIYESTA